MNPPKEPDNFDFPLTGSNLPRVETSLRSRFIGDSVPVERLSPASLAYLGDAVYELYIRTHYLLPPKRLSTYHQKVVTQVRAETQANQLRSLIPYLTKFELEIVRRGRNASSKSPRRLSPDIYQQATALETLIGYLYISDPQRLNELLAKLVIN
ncbi:MAG: ribonuclease III domain-containing protein [Spirulinaceae cyanobacterium]